MPYVSNLRSANKIMIGPASIRCALVAMGSLLRMIVLRCPFEASCLGLLGRFCRDDSSDQDGHYLCHLILVERFKWPAWAEVDRKVVRSWM